MHFFKCCLIFYKNLLSIKNITFSPIYWKVIIDNSIYNSKTIWYCLMWDLFILDQINNQQTTQKCSLNLTVWALVLICYDPFLESKNHEIQFIFNLISICMLNKQVAQVDEAKKLTSLQVKKIIPFDNDVFSLFNISYNELYFVFFLELQKQISNIKTLISILLFRLCNVLLITLWSNIIISLVL